MSDGMDTRISLLKRINPRMGASVERVRDRVESNAQTQSVSQPGTVASQSTSPPLVFSGGRWVAPATSTVAPVPVTPTPVAPVTPTPPPLVFHGGRWVDPTTVPEQQYRIAPMAFQQQLEPGMAARIERYRSVDTGQTYVLGSGSHIFHGGRWRRSVVSGEELKAIRKREMEEYNVLYTSALGLKPYQYVRETKTGYSIETDLEAKASYEWERSSPIQKTVRAMTVGITQFPRFYLGGFLDTEQYGKDLVVEESQVWSKVKSGDWKAAYVYTGTSPLAQEAAFLGIMKGAGWVARPVARGLIRGSAHVGGKIVRFAGVSTSKVVSKIGASRFVSTGAKEVGKRTYQWAAHGYKFGSRLVPGGARQVSRVPLKTGMERMSKTIVTGGKHRLERVWMSPTQQAVAKVGIAKKLAAKPVMDMPFPKSGHDVVFTQTGSWKLKGTTLTQKIATSTTKYVDPDPWIIGDKTINWFGITDIGTKYGGFVRELPKNLSSTIDDVVSGSYTTKLKPYEGRFRVFPDPVSSRACTGRHGSRRCPRIPARSG